MHENVTNITQFFYKLNIAKLQISSLVSLIRMDIEAGLQWIYIYKLYKPFYTHPTSKQL